MKKGIKSGTAQHNEVHVKKHDSILSVLDIFQPSYWKQQQIFLMRSRDNFETCWWQQNWIFVTWHQDNLWLCLRRESQINHDVFLTLTRWVLCLDLTRTLTQHCHNMKLKTCGSIKKFKVSTYLWSCRNVLYQQLFCHLSEKHWLNRKSFIKWNYKITACFWNRKFLHHLSCKMNKQCVPNTERSF